MPREMQSGCITLGLVLALVLGGCTHVVTSPSPPDVRTIAVFPVDDRTGSALYADAPPLLSLVSDGPPARRTTVAQMLADEICRVLVERGFTVVPPARLSSSGPPPEVDGSIGIEGEPPRDASAAAQRLAALGIDATALLVQLWRWDPDDPSHLTYVDVKLDAILIAPDGRVVWQAHWPASPVAAGGASSVALGYPEVVRRVVHRTLGDLRPASVTPR